MRNLVEDRSLHNRESVFEDRRDAGARLAHLLSPLRGSDAIVFAIPSGGVPVAVEIHKVHGFPFDLLVVRKVQIPWSTEAGFGAVNLDGEVILNEDLVDSLGMPQEAVEAQIEKTREILRKRDGLFRKGRPFPAIEKKTAILVDDGLASGYSMMAAIRFVRKRNPFQVVVAVPTGSSGALARVSPLVDVLYCLNVREGYPYAVADAYRDWYDLSDEEVVKLLEEADKAEKGDHQEA
ncbi:MAG: phosphoribosyltransferase family protein [candidate division NC10 bacterium]|nr:phosphoribosyltransferase family protein [candidate division NC10 bacterium]